ncbi:MAG: RND transporter [Gammaproteobacteria bacterium 28-57-27]|nr:MAG: RND transporter [Gammaproteobacteria bacterium 28-57-27]
MKLKTLLPLLILALAVIGFMALKATRSQPAPVVIQERVWHVETQSIQPETLQPELTLYGRIEAPDRVKIAAPVSGRVLNVLVRDGESVQAGQALAELDARDLQPRVAQIKSDIERENLNLANDRAALKQEQQVEQLALSSLQRNESIQAQKLGSQAATDTAREQLARARLSVLQRQQAIAEAPSRLAQLKSKLDEAQRDAERGVMSAPFAARIGSVEVAAGDQVTPGQTMLTLYPADALFLRAKVPVPQAEILRRGLNDGTPLLARIEFNGKTTQARLERLSGEADARGVDALLKLDASTTQIPVGSLLSAQLALPAQDGLIALPYSALHGGTRVYLLRDGRLHAVEVKRVGEMRQGEQSRILLRAAELVPGAVVMTTHLPNAIEGLSVTPVQASNVPGEARS